MALYLIGIGLSDENDITIKGLDLVKKSDVIYLENYTSLLNCPVANLEKLYGKKIILADRELVEKRAETTILKEAKEKNVSFLVVGDPLAATTHFDLLARAKSLNIPVKVIHNASVMTVVSIIGLQLYKFGKTTSIPFPSNGFEPETAYEVIKSNKSLGLHTLILLDLKPEEKKFMSISDAIKILLKIEEKHNEAVFTKDTLCIGCSSLGSDSQVVKAGTADVLVKAKFSTGLHCLIVPGELHFVEQEAVQQLME